jgi:glycosyltransferase involved in cell wall biosynthesis
VRVLQIMECTIGGTRRHLRDLAHGLSQRGVSVEVVCAALREPRMREDMAAMQAAGIVVHELPMVRPIKPLTDLRHWLKLAWIVLDRRFDVIHTHSSKAGALGRSVGVLLSGAARVHTPHTYAISFEGGKGQGGEAPGSPGLILATERLLGRVTDRLIHVSMAEREEARSLGVIAPRRSRVVANGIDAAPFEAPHGGAEVRAEFGIPAAAPVVGTVGLLNDAKGLDLLIDALHVMPDDVHLLLVGHGELEPDLRRQAEALGLAERVHITGWRDDVSPCHDAMDVFCLSSRWEGLSYSLLEALAAGLPCVSTEVNGSREVLISENGGDSCGRLVPREDSRALADALSELLADEALRAELSGAARRRVPEAFTVDHMVDGTLAIYREVLGQSETPA